MKEKFILGEEMKGDLVITGYIATAKGDYLVVNGKVYNRVNGDKAKADWNPNLYFWQNLKIIMQRLQLVILWDLCFMIICIIVLW